MSLVRILSDCTKCSWALLTRPLPGQNRVLGAVTDSLTGYGSFRNWSLMKKEVSKTIDIWYTTIKKVSEDYESMKYNTAIAQMMTL